MLVIQNVLQAEELAELRAFLKSAPFVDGKVTAPGAVKKSNRQADQDDPAVKAHSEKLIDVLGKSKLFQLYTRPVRYSAVLFNAYGVGETYGLHIDEPLMGQDTPIRLRTDFSFTLFLSAPEEYEGGELVVAAVEGDRKFKLRAGDMVVYSTGAIHRVNPVVSGERLAAIGWVQSLIRGSDQRGIVFDLSRIRSSIPDADTRLVLEKAISNLIRLWGEV